MKNLLAAIVLFSALSCNQKDESKIVPVNMTDTIAAADKKASDINKQLGDTILLTSKDEKGTYAAEGTIDSLHSRIYVKFTNAQTGKLTAVIKPTAGKGNIRFNQIIFPDQTADGPFGINIEQELKQTGEHTLIIGHSLMADNPYIGNFSLELLVTAK
jgi:hypothetical protein